MDIWSNFDCAAVAKYFRNVQLFRNWKSSQKQFRVMSKLEPLICAKMWGFSEVVCGRVSQFIIIRSGGFGIMKNLTLKLVLKFNCLFFG